MNTQAAFEQLILKAEANQWSIEQDIAWDERLVVPRVLPRAVYVDVVSQLYHGEVATGRMCARMQHQMNEPAALRCLDMQRRDEGRHADAYARYLERLGDIAPVHDAVQQAYDAALARVARPTWTLLAYHVLLEGEALRLQQDLARRFPCPVLRQINLQAAHDEARHVAFGKLYLRRTLPMLAAEERWAAYRWLRALWYDCATATLDRYRVVRVVPRRVRQDWLDARWRHQRRALIGIGLVSEQEATRC